MRHYGPAPKPEPRTRTPKRLRSAPKPATAQEVECRAVVTARSGGLCETCGAPGASDKAHRVARSQQGLWDPANILDLCRDCHADHHANPSQAYTLGWHLRSHQDPSSTPAWLWVKGDEGWFILDSDGNRKPVPVGGSK